MKLEMTKPVNHLKQHYKENDGFRKWVKANEEWFMNNPNEFRRLVENPRMVNLFMEMMAANASRLDRRLKRLDKRRQTRSKRKKVKK